MSSSTRYTSTCCLEPDLFSRDQDFICDWDWIANRRRSFRLDIRLHGQMELSALTTVLRLLVVSGASSELADDRPEIY
jgi:hypothetical protein